MGSFSHSTYFHRSGGVLRQDNVFMSLMSLHVIDVRHTVIGEGALAEGVAKNVTKLFRQLCVFVFRSCFEGFAKSLRAL